MGLLSMHAKISTNNKDKKEYTSFMRGKYKVNNMDGQQQMHY